jgi:hypothetical protein
MPTNQIVLKTVEEFNRDYVPVYSPLFPLLLAAGNSRQYPMEVGKLNFNTIEAVSDIRNKRITPKDTHIHQINAIGTTKSFKKYFNASQYLQSQFQDNADAQRVVSQVIDENNKAFDDLLLFGEGSSNSTMLNNGLFWSNDPNYTLESNANVASTGAGRVANLYAQIAINAAKANGVAGRKLLMPYGSDVNGTMLSLFASSEQSLLSKLQTNLGNDYTVVPVPTSLYSATNGIIIVNVDQVVMHYTGVPQLLSRGLDEQNMKYWFNFVHGSSMVEVTAQHGIIRQPITYT